MEKKSKKKSIQKEIKSPIKIVRYSDMPKPKLTPAQRKQVIEALSLSTKRAMGKKFRERWGKLLKE